MLRTLDMPRRLPSEIDLALLWSTLLLLVIGMVMVYSASMATAEAGRATGNQSTYFLLRHAAFLIIALVAASIAFQIPLTTWQRWSPWLFVGGSVLLALVLVPGVGREVNGARRWLSLGIVNLQPSAQPSTASFCNADDTLIPSADLWLHGHLHCRLDYTVERPGGGHTRVVSHARGLAGKGEARGHDAQRLIELPSRD